MKFEKEEKEKTHTFSFRIKQTVRDDLEKIAVREKIPPAVIVRKAIRLLIEQDKKDQENGN